MSHSDKNGGREIFEKWVLLDPRFDESSLIRDKVGGYYEIQSVYQLWSAWCEGRKHAAAPQPSLAAPVPLLTEYRRRAKGLKDAIERSQQMERDFLEKKVLNAQANEAMDEVGAKQRIFAVWLLQVSDDLIAECLAAQSPQAPQYDAVADAVNEIADAAEEAFKKAGLTDPGEWDGDNIVKDVKRGLVRSIEALAARSHTEAPLTTLLAWAVGERSSWEGNNADRHWQMNRVVGQIEDAIASAPPSATDASVAKDAERYRWLRAHSWLDTSLIESVLNFGPGYGQTKPELLDAAIDAATDETAER